MQTHEVIPLTRLIARIENEVDDGQHGGDPLANPRALRNLVRNAGVADFALGAHQALGHRGHGGEKGPGDLLGGKAAPSVRKVRATWASWARAGWQQVKMSFSRSSG